MVALNFSAQSVQPNVALEAVPSDNYRVMITKSEEKPTKAGNGSYIELEMTIQTGPFANRKVYDRLNIKNPNQQAVDIAYSTLSAICHVTGRFQIQDTQQLHGVPFTAVVIKKERDDQKGTFSNEVRGYKDVNGNDPGFTGQTGTPAAQPSWAGAPQPGAAPQPPQPQPGAPAFTGQPPAQPMAPQGQPQGGPPAWAPQQGQAEPQQTAAPLGLPPQAPGGAPPWAQQTGA